MESTITRNRSELPGGDPALLNNVAWARRWSDRRISRQYAMSAKAAAELGAGRRSRTQQGIALRTIAWQARWSGDLDAAMSSSLSAETFLSEKDHPELRSVIYSVLGSIHFSRNRFDLAASSVDRGFWLLRKRPEDDIRDAMTELLLTKSTIQRHAGERARAGITLGRAKEVALEQDIPIVEYCTALWLLAEGDVDASRLRAVAAMDAAVEQGNRLILPYLHSVLGCCDARIGRIDESIQHFETGLDLAMADKDDRVQCFLLRSFGQIEADQGRLEPARSHLENAAKLAKRHSNLFERKRIALARAKLFENLGQYKKAVEQHNLAWRLQNETRTV